MAIKRAKTAPPPLPVAPSLISPTCTPGTEKALLQGHTVESVTTATVEDSTPSHSPQLLPTAVSSLDSIIPIPFHETVQNTTTTQIPPETINITGVINNSPSIDLNLDLNQIDDTPETLPTLNLEQTSNTPPPTLQPTLQPPNWILLKVKDNRNRLLKIYSKKLFMENALKIIEESNKIPKSLKINVKFQASCFTPARITNDFNELIKNTESKILDLLKEAKRIEISEITLEISKMSENITNSCPTEYNNEIVKIIDETLKEAEVRVSNILKKKKDKQTKARDRRINNNNIPLSHLIRNEIRTYNNISSRSNGRSSENASTANNTVVNNTHNNNNIINNKRRKRQKQQRQNPTLIPSPSVPLPPPPPPPLPPPRRPPPLLPTPRSSVPLNNTTTTRLEQHNSSPSRSIYATEIRRQNTSNPIHQTQQTTVRHLNPLSLTTTTAPNNSRTNISTNSAPSRISNSVEIGQQSFPGNSFNYSNEAILSQRPGLTNQTCFGTSIPRISLPNPIQTPNLRTIFNGAPPTQNYTSLHQNDQHNLLFPTNPFTHPNRPLQPSLMLHPHLPQDRSFHPAIYNSQFIHHNNLHRPGLLPTPQIPPKTNYNRHNFNYNGHNSNFQNTRQTDTQNYANIHQNDQHNFPLPTYPLTYPNEPLQPLQSLHPLPPPNRTFHPVIHNPQIIHHNNLLRPGLLPTPQIPPSTHYNGHNSNSQNTRHYSRRQTQQKNGLGVPTRMLVEEIHNRSFPGSL